MPSTVDPGRPGETAATSPAAGPADGDPPSTTVAAEDYRLREGGLGGDVYFVSPTGNIHCRLGDWTVAAAGCQAKGAPVPPGGEKECAGNEIYPASSLSRGYLLYPDRARPICFNQGYLGAPNAKKLPYNSSVAANGYTCTSRVEGVTCLTAAGAHGFFMSTQALRSW
ncbi:hypothetical protein FK529_00655 [Tsukamurella asaccharolytica]|uniref:Uncharacterized protein n=1 Tax=Tsukamurella asaccharolytica TaxID=2592067 RepID=A0A5C5RFL0_9ACTN|nr:hypothetical protein [Tsukamurella asaccharolytica]TWS21163.1 hypothetical protein FK529_00655 [Tsukamurella asaccharolytica]